MSYAYMGPGGPARHPAPISVLSARILLSVQASIWALLAFGLSPSALSYLYTGSVPHFDGATAAWAVIAPCFAAGSAALALYLKPGRKGVRRTVIGLETLMACFGTYLSFKMLPLPSGEWPTLPGALILLPAAFWGAVLSLACVMGLLSRTARRFARSLPAG
ncbi:hypothetical protein [Actinoallomurus vinaceus]